MFKYVDINELARLRAERQQADFIWGHFFNYCKSFYSKGGVYGDEVNATDQEIEQGILDLLDRFDHEFEGDSFDREIVRNNIERNRKNSHLVCRAVYQIMHHDHVVKGEQNV